MCAEVDGLSFLDTALMNSWEICGKQRRSDVKGSEPYWAQRTAHIPTHALLGTDAGGKRLLIFEMGDTFQRSLGVFHISGERDHTIDLPRSGDVGVIRVDKFGNAAAIGYLRGKSESLGVYFKVRKEPWTLVSPIDDIRGDVSLTERDIVWTDKGSIWGSPLEPIRKRLIAGAGDLPSLSPDGQVLFFRDSRHLPTFWSWPNMQRIASANAKKPVGRVAVWSPNAAFMIVEQLGIFLNLEAIRPSDGQVYSLGMVRSRGSVEGSIYPIYWGQAGPAQLVDFQERNKGDS